MLAQTLPTGQTARIWSSSRARKARRRARRRVGREALARFEADVSSGEPESVLLADDSDAALAAALVATKLLIAVSATESAQSEQAPTDA